MSTHITAYIIGAQIPTNTRFNWDTLSSPPGSSVYMPIRILGTDAPESTGITSDWDTAVEFERRAMTGAEVAEAMAASFAHLRSAMEATAGDLDQELTLGSNTRTVGQIWVGIVAHLHEHLGQSIAYARTNQIVPPWSM